MGVEVQKLIERTAAARTRTVLYALAQDLTRQVLQTWDAAPEGAQLEQTELLEQVEERALRQANVLGGSHAFLLETYAGTTVVGSEVFRVTAEVLANGVSVAHEPANEGGMLAQMMRHNEAYARNSVGAFDKAAQVLLKHAESTSRHVVAVETKFSELMIRMQELVLGEHQVKIDLVKAENTAALQRVFAEKVAGVLPEFIGSITGKLSNTPGAAAAIKAKSAFSTLSQEQLAAILNLLNMDQKIAVMGLMKSLAEDSEKGGANATH